VRVVWAKYPFDVLGEQPNRAEHVASEHASILNALRARDAAGAMKAMRSHIESGQRLFKASYPAK
jgi:DNA-binding GntR family transcriptional regulator